MVSVRIDEQIFIDPAEAAMVTDEVEPNEFVHYDVNLNKRTCGYGHWQHYGIACEHALSVWEKYQEQLEETNGARMEADAYVEARASFSPDALTGMEANLRFPGPETMESKIFSRLSAWQNWIFQRPNAVGEQGALVLYGTGQRPKYQKNRV